MNNQIDTSIPVLTEVIQPEELTASSIEAAVSGDETAVNTVNTTADTTPQRANQAITGHYPGKQEEDWLALEQTLRENVLRQVLARIDFVLEHRIRDNLADVLQVAVTNLSTEIRSGLHKTLEEVITRAVSQEITKARSQK